MAKKNIALLERVNFIKPETPEECKRVQDECFAIEAILTRIAKKKELDKKGGENLERKGQASE